MTKKNSLSTKKTSVKRTPTETMALTADTKGSLPSGQRCIHAFSLLGAQTEKTAVALLSNGSLFATQMDDDLVKLADVLRQGDWNDSESANLISVLFETFEKGTTPNVSSMRRWVLAHPNDVAKVKACMNVIPPDGIDILEVKTDVGSQKQVFLAVWRLTQKQVVLKQILAVGDAGAKIQTREDRAHPLSIDHKHVMKTYRETNMRGERFNVEDYMSGILSDHSRVGGLDEAANLLFHLLDALDCLHNQHHLVHGDIKPDNIGKIEDNYVLLDFGICRPAAEFTPESTPTGSLRTRAPELILNIGYPIDPFKVDIWAVGATVYNALLGRFPLFKLGEQVPKVFDLKSRAEKEQELRDRINSQWDEFVKLQDIEEPIRSLLKVALEKDPKDRWSAEKLKAEAKTTLAQFLRLGFEGADMSKPDEAQKLAKFLPDLDTLKLMPRGEKDKMVSYFRDLESHLKLKDSANNRITKLIHELA